MSLSYMYGTNKFRHLFIAPNYVHVYVWLTSRIRRQLDTLGIKMELGIMKCAS